MGLLDGSEEPEPPFYRIGINCFILTDVRQRSNRARQTCRRDIRISLSAERERSADSRFAKQSL